MKAFLIMTTGKHPLMNQGQYAIFNTRKDANKHLQLIDLDKMPDLTIIEVEVRAK